MIASLFRSKVKIYSGNLGYSVQSGLVCPSHIAGAEPVLLKGLVMYERVFEQLEICWIKSTDIYELDVAYLRDERGCRTSRFVRLQL
jgi:hypothetical protein